MAFSYNKTTIEEGDLAAIYLSFSKTIMVTVKPGQKIQTVFGVLDLATLVGQTYGKRVNLKNGYVYVLSVTPELWTDYLPHRTQVMYTPDISAVLGHLNIRSGSIVVEAGTGSGSMSHAILRTIQPSGHLYTFDVHEDRVQLAREEFRVHGFEACVTIACRDVGAEGFCLPSSSLCDAVTLDLPAPWSVIPKITTKLLKSGGRISCFSPCIEQVQKTHLALREAKFCDLHTIVVICKPMEVKTRRLEEYAGLQSASVASIDNDSEPSRKRARVVDDGEREHQQQQNEEKTAEVVLSSADDGATALNMMMVEKQQQVQTVENQSLPDSQTLNTSHQNGRKGQQTRNAAKKLPSHMLATCTPIRRTVGHTGYLTFASYYYG